MGASPCYQNKSATRTHISAAFKREGIVTLSDGRSFYLEIYFCLLDNKRQFLEMQTKKYDSI